MIDFITHLLIEYKYWIVIIGALIEGEVILLLASGAAYHGYLNIYGVVGIAFLGVLFHDHALFFLGRAYGNRLLEKNQTIHRKAQRVLELCRKYENFFILGFRFIYGIRTITPMIIGMNRIPIVKYSVLTITAGIIWSVVIGVGGYYSAAAIDVVIENFAKYQKILAGILFVIGILLWGWYQIKKTKA